MSAVTVQAPARKGLGPLAATALVTGNMVGSGLFLLPASLAAIGSASLIGWGVAAVGAMALALVYAKLAIIRPDPDGLIRYPADGLHPWAGRVAWWAYWATGWTGNVAIALGAVGYLAFFLPALIGPWPTVAATVAVAWIIAGANLAGPKVVAWLSGSTLLIGALPVAMTVLVGVLAFDPHVFVGSWNVSGRPLAQALPPSLVTIFWAYLGVESAAFAARAVDNPERNLPIAAIGGVALASVIYVAAMVAIMGIIPAHELARSTAPFADATRQVLGPAAGAVVAACALAKTLGTLGGWVLVTGEVCETGARTGYLPRILSSRPGAGAPVKGILLTTTLMSVVALATVSPTLARQFNVLTNVTVLASLLVYVLCALALIRFLIRDRAPRRVPMIAVALAATAFCIWVSIAAFG